MKRASIAVLSLFALAALAQAPAGFEVVSSARLKAFTKSLAPKINAQKVATEQLYKWNNHLLMVAHREGDGEAELHQTQADIMIVETGAATLKVGGKVVNPKDTAPNEVRGPSISGGEEKKIGPGDIVHIPHGVPHQVLVPSGQVTYAIVKVDER